MKKELAFCLVTVGLSVMLVGCTFNKVNTANESSEITINVEDSTEEVSAIPEIEDIINEEIEEIIEESTEEEVTNEYVEEATDEIADIPTEEAKPVESTSESSNSSGVLNNAPQEPQNAPQSQADTQQSVNSQPQESVSQDNTASSSTSSILTPEEQAFLDSLPSGTVTEYAETIGDGSGGSVDDSNAIFH